MLRFFLKQIAVLDLCVFSMLHTCISANHHYEIA